MADASTAPDQSPVERVIAELRSIRSTDPCAAIAMTTIKATIHTLESRWCHPGGESAGPSRNV